jgi:hypothetical protein
MSMWPVNSCSETETCALLAVDVGVRTGLAFYSADGRLNWYQSRNFGNAVRLRRGVRAFLEDLPDVAYLVLEGGGPLADSWHDVADYMGIVTHQISAETWRESFFYPRQYRTTALAKQTADTMARQVIEWAGAPRPTSLRHDAAEAILVGLWAVLQLGWLPELPRQLGRR